MVSSVHIRTVIPSVSHSYEAYIFCIKNLKKKRRIPFVWVTFSLIYWTQVYLLYPLPFFCAALVFDVLSPCLVLLYLISKTEKGSQNLVQLDPNFRLTPWIAVFQELTSLHKDMKQSLKNCWFRVMWLIH